MLNSGFSFSSLRWVGVFPTLTKVTLVVNSLTFVKLNFHTHVTLLRMYLLLMYLLLMYLLLMYLLLIY